MAAYEVLLLNTAIPQIQAAQSGDTYVVPRDIAFSAVALLANGTNSAPSLAFSSDTNTGIYRAAADSLAIATGGSQVALFSLDGNNSYVNFSGVGLADAVQLYAGYSGTSSFLAIGTKNSGTLAEKMRIDSSGNLLVGTTSARTLLTVAGSISLGATPAAGVAGTAYSITGNSASSSTAAGGDLTIAAGGGSGVSTNGNLILRAGQTVSSLSITTGGNLVLESGKPSDGATGGYIAFNTYTGNPSTATERARITSTGDFGIGTNNPGSKLHVDGAAGSGSGDVAIRLRDSTSTNTLQMIRTGATYSYGGIGGNEGALYSANTLTLCADSSSVIKFAAGGTERARITSGGSLIVGPSGTSLYDAERISVVAAASQRAAYLKNDTAAVTNTLIHNAATSGDNVFIGFGTEATYTGRGSISYNRTGGLVAYNTTSDYRAKDIIGQISNPGAVIDALKVYEGKMKGAEQSRPMLVAHEAQEFAPYAVTGEKDAVNEDGTPKYQQMDVSSLVPLLLAEIQSLRARVKALEGA